MSLFAGKCLLIAIITPPWREDRSIDGSLSLRKMLKSCRYSSLSLMFLIEPGFSEAECHVGARADCSYKLHPSSKNDQAFSVKEQTMKFK